MADKPDLDHCPLCGTKVVAIRDIGEPVTSMKIVCPHGCFRMTTSTGRKLYIDTGEEGG